MATNFWKHCGRLELLDDGLESNHLIAEEAGKVDKGGKKKFRKLEVVSKKKKNLGMREG